MTKMIFLCYGNICRSPMAEFVMKDLVAKAGLSDKFEMIRYKLHGLVGRTTLTGEFYDRALL